MLIALGAQHPGKGMPLQTIWSLVFALLSGNARLGTAPCGRGGPSSEKSLPSESQRE